MCLIAISKSDWFNRVSFRALLFLAAWLVFPSIWAGGDPWKEKPFQQWDQNDLKKILGDSPWAKVIRVAAPWKGDGGSQGSGEGIPRPEIPRGMTGVGQGNNPAPTAGSVPGAGGSQEPPQAAFLVRWVSSLTTRQAIYRGAVLAGQIKEAEAEKALAQPVEEYQVLILGPDMKPFESANEDSLKGSAFLLTKKSKQRIAPDRVQMERNPDSKTVQYIVFFFPKKSANGEENIATDEKGIEFTFSYGPVDIRAGFDPAKMTNRNGRDL